MIIGESFRRLKLFSDGGAVMMGRQTVDQLNFVPDKQRALVEMKRVTRAGGTVGFYVWDYPGGGVEFMHAFWNAATSLDAGAEAYRGPALSILHAR